VRNGGMFCMPILVSETQNSEVTIISYPNDVINETFSIPATTDSNKLVCNVWVAVPQMDSGSYIEINHNFISEDSIGITLLVTDELKYSPIQILFQNKFGAEQVVTFFKERSSNMSVSSESFESDRGQPIDGKHQFVTYNV